MDPQKLKQYPTDIAIRAIADEYGVSVRFLCGGNHLDDTKVIYAMYGISQLSFANKSMYDDTAKLFGCGESYASHCVRTICSQKKSGSEFIEQFDRIMARAVLLEIILEPIVELSDADRKFFFTIVDSMFEISQIPVSDFLDMEFSSIEADAQRSILVYLSQRFASKRVQDAIAEILSLDANAIQKRSEDITTAMSQDPGFKKTMENIADIILEAASSK